MSSSIETHPEHGVLENNRLEEENHVSDTIDERQTPHGIVLEDNATKTDDVDNVTPDNATEEPIMPDTSDLPKEEPMPSPEECFNNHLSKKLLNMLGERSAEEIERLHKVHSPHVLATHVESVYRAMKPHQQNIKMMQTIAQQFGKSKKERANWEKTYSTFAEKYTDAEKDYHDALEELNATVRNYIHELIDKEQREQMEKYKLCKPLSKGKRRHFFDALSKDDDAKLMKTLETVHDVQSACYSIQHTSHRNNPKLALLCFFVHDHRSLPSEGAHKCLQALLTKYNDFFEESDIQDALKHIHDDGLDAEKSKSVEVFKKYCKW